MTANLQCLRRNRTYEEIKRHYYGKVRKTIWYYRKCTTITTQTAFCRILELLERLSIIFSIDKIYNTKMKLSLLQMLKRQQLVEEQFRNTILSGAQLGGGEGRSSLPFLKIEKNALILGKKKKKTMIVSIFWVKCSIQNIVLRVSRKKAPKFLLAGPFSVFLTKCLSKCPSSTKPPLL